MKAAKLEFPMGGGGGWGCKTRKQKFLVAGGVLEPKILEAKYEAKLEFPGAGGGGGGGF